MDITKEVVTGVFILCFGMLVTGVVNSTVWVANKIARSGIVGLCVAGTGFAGLGTFGVVGVRAGSLSDEVFIPLTVMSFMACGFCLVAAQLRFLSARNLPD
jgi:hypothetical protein